ncbi:MAG TPA: Gfo/Idh/MocA family oxidoreductase [Pirellulales bacterium]|nr:Gfo/Idh/MocA family oxidoreductase [Pirellulales bacterium]
MLPTASTTILIAGFGSIGRRHFRNLRELGYERFVFLRTRRGSLDDAEIAAWPSVHSVEEALAHRPSVAVIANPSALHVPVALAAAEAGCALFVEKPLSDSLSGCEQLLTVVRQKKLTTMIGCQFRFHPLTIALRNALLEGRLGSPLGAEAEWGEYLPAWHPWENYRESYSARKELGGGVVLTLIHPLDYLFWLFGRTRRITGTTRPVPALKTPAGEDWADMLLEFADGGVVARVHLDYWQRPPVHRLSVWGEQGTAKIDFHAGTLHYQMVDGTTASEKVPEGFERNAMFLDEMRHFLECCHAGQPSSIPLEEGIAVLEMALEARKVDG